MSRRERPYLFYGATRALCSKCFVVCDAKELIEGDKVFLWKRCFEHGVERVLISDDVEYFRLCREVFLKPPEQVEKYNTRTEWGCPYDCGICPDHEQHGCVSVLEVTDFCNLRCPTCFAASGPHRETHRSLAQLERMLDRIVANEREPDVVQLSGGEPTLHPQFFAIVDACRARPIRHLMLNTNGIRIATEQGFAERLAAYQPGFEIYMQFDSLHDEVTQHLRGASLSQIKQQALDKLNALNLSTTLVVTLKRGINDHQIGEILAFAARQRAVRGVTLQPVQDSGRNESYDSAAHRLTLSEVRRRVYEQSPVFTPADIVPVPCDPDMVAMGYAIRDADDFTKLTPLTRYVPSDVLINAGKNTIIYEDDSALMGAVAKHIFKTFSTAHGPEGANRALGDLLCCLPRVELMPSLTYDRVFRVILMQFLDQHAMDLRAVRKSCVHIAHPDGERLIPFDTYNLFYRDALETERLAPIRRRIEQGRHAVSGQRLPMAAI